MDPTMKLKFIWENINIYDGELVNPVWMKLNKNIGARAICLQQKLLVWSTSVVKMMILYPLINLIGVGL